MPLKCDIKKFFDSIDHIVLIELIKKKVSDENTLWLLQRIIKSFSVADHRGIPMGNITSQLFANIYMNWFDQFIKHQLKVRYYIRYCDDFLILSPDKEYLRTLVLHMNHFLKNTLKLQLHPNKIFIKTFASGIDFLGWVNFYNHRTLRTTTKRRMFKKLQNPKVGSLQSYLGLISHGNSYMIYKKFIMRLKQKDPQIAKLIDLETERQKTSLEMIPSENHSSPAVREPLGSLLTDKYAEGYPGKRYYSGLKYYDQLEILCQERVKKLFGVEHANVQPYSGSPANAAVYMATCEPGDTIMGMGLAMGGHLTHGFKLSFSGKFFKSFAYSVDEKTHLINYDEAERLAKEHKPKLIWVGGSAYPRTFNWKRMGKIADSVGAYLAADIAHIAGLVAGGAHPSPVPYVHIITTTTHKTLRGPRGGIVMVTKKGIEKDSDLPKKIDRAVFPGLQGGPHENSIAGIAVCLKEASTSAFKKYAKQVVKNAKVLAEELKKYGFNLVSGGTENHLILIDLRNKNITGSAAADLLEEAGITINKNSIPYDTASPFNPSGIRMGTPAITTRGMKEKEMKKIAEWINEALSQPKSVKKIREEIKRFCKKFPLPR